MSKAMLIGLGAAGTGIGGICVYQWSGSDESTKEITISISDLFKSSQNKVLLTKTSDAGDWNKAWIKYRDANKDREEDEWNIVGFSGKKTEDSAFQEFKNACESKYLIKVKEVGDSNYRRVADWCTRPKKISELLESENGRELIPSDNANDDWTASWKKYREAHKEGSTSSYKSSDTWSIGSWNTDKNSESLSTNFKAKCLENAKKDVVTGKEDKLYGEVKDWCTRTKKISG
ncbi:hypothetical protein MHC_03640 [Mycoplasma haemocanis str. Illinois]|uniref:Uncharacterized protein n=1 Tax=Mycoplasma haemocanis (strain Illinois) TaxID=1111676 RepID=H6N7G6_MYCHN|nr:hypothetical protein [Mycoplasma haemocanis]AEW45588.2 hypothetical protein MHC_03640 [Mycoplasma haemocanis str. Illinois]